MDKNTFAVTPPMGWNSWDCYGASVTEEELLGNANYMAEHMKAYGWEYIVCDIQWYEPSANTSVYHKFAPLEMDEFGRLIPAVNRFPSSAGQKGFGPIAKKIHDLGLKFGIHMMRGVPRQAVHAQLPVKGTTVTARDIAHPFSLCSWNTDMYGVDTSAVGAQAYYDSLFELYAEWGVDYVKVDDICTTAFLPYDLYSAKEEIEMIHRAISRCKREIVLSLSPGPALLTQAGHLSRYANMWRITGDFWDRWEDIREMFDICRDWSPYVKEGCWPDCDMLPLGHISIRGNEHGLSDRFTRFTREEQTTLMTLWCIFRSPLMMGGELRDNDPWTLELLTNAEVLSLLKDTSGAGEIYRGSDIIAWTSQDARNNTYLAIFNIGWVEKTAAFSLDKIGLPGPCQVRDLWNHRNQAPAREMITASIPIHGAVLYKLTPDPEIK